MENSPLLITDYNPDTKTIDVAYYLLGDKPNTFQIINIQESEKKNAIWADGSTDYFMKIQTESLPKKYVELVGPVEGVDGYHIFRIPYWMYKKDPNLQIKRLNVPKKRFSKPKEEDVRLFGKQEYLKALEGTGTDMKKVRAMYDFAFSPRPETPEPTPVEKDNSRPFRSYRKTYWGD